jgi:hypothetical protein
VLRILSIVLYPQVINGCYVNVMLPNSHCTFIPSNPLLDMHVSIQRVQILLTSMRRSSPEGDTKVTIYVHLPCTWGVKKTGYAVNACAALSPDGLL